MNSPIQISPSPVQQTHVKQPEQQESSTNATPPKGSLESHSIYQKGARGSGLLRDWQLAPVRFRQASKGKHIGLLEKDAGKQLSALLIKLGALSHRCSGKAPLAAQQWSSAYQAIETAQGLNEKCRVKLKELKDKTKLTSDDAATLEKDIGDTEAALYTVLAAVQRNRAAIPRARL